MKDTLTTNRQVQKERRLRKVQDFFALLKSAIDKLANDFDLATLLNGLRTLRIFMQCHASNMSHSEFSSTRNILALIVKESLKRITYWAEKYYTHNKLYWVTNSIDLYAKQLSVRRVPKTRPPATYAESKLAVSTVHFTEDSKEFQARLQANSPE